MTEWTPLDEALEKVLYDHSDGYYQQKNPFGKTGDFVTAPEISSLFGEMIAVWALNKWQEAGSPLPLRLVEFGPGQGVMMADILRILHKLSTRLWENFEDLVLTEQISCHLIEVSERLQKIQAQSLLNYAPMVHWNESLENISDGYTIIFANEFFDALPIKQYIRKQNQWYERGLTEDHSFKDMPCSPPPLRFSATDSEVCEICPKDLWYAKKISARLKIQGGAALLIDYGDDFHIWQGETLQALKHHTSVSIEDSFGKDRGECDITHHVDFWELREFFTKEGLLCQSTQTQQTFLLNQGIASRANQLAKNLLWEQREVFFASLNRLLSPQQMGVLFKVLEIQTPKR